MANPSPVPLEEFVEISKICVPPPVARTVASDRIAMISPFPSRHRAPITRSLSRTRSSAVTSLKISTLVDVNRSMRVIIISWPVLSPA